MNTQWLYILYATLGIIYYWAGLQIWNKGRKNMVNIHSGRLQLYALITAIVGLLFTYYILHNYIVEILDKLSLSAIFIPPLMVRRQPNITKILDGRGDFNIKADKVLMLGFGVVIAFWLYTMIAKINFITAISKYAPSLILFVAGFYLIGNKDDNLTRFGYGLTAVAILYTIAIMQLFS